MIGPGDALPGLNVEDPLAQLNFQALTSLKSQVASLLPAGSIISFGGNSVPTGWMECNGIEVPAVYTPLIAALVGAPHGTGANGLPRVPDLRGRVIAGINGSTRLPGATAVGSTTGAATVALALSEMPNHSHGASNNFVTDGFGGSPANITIGGTGYRVVSSTGSAGSGSAHSNVQSTMSLLYLIRTGL